MKKGALKRDVTVQEVSSLDQDLKKGREVFKYHGYTYGCISENGVAVSDKPGEGPFYEIPANAVEWE